jgi:stress-induced-phosphoprotein 1
MGDYGKAIEFFQRSLTEHRTPEILTKLRDVEKTKADAERLAYIDPGKAEESREEGNALFKKADYPSAIKAYTEAVKRAPEDPRGYANRAAAYIKLASFPEAIKALPPFHPSHVLTL